MAIQDINEVKKIVTKNAVYQLKISIQESNPSIWRRVLIDKNISFGELHLIIQNVFEWENYHMHHFIIDDNSVILDTEDDFYEKTRENEFDEFDTKVSEYLKNVGDEIRYCYDFSDDWNHEIKLEEIIDKKSGVNYPQLIDGERVGPLEDTGGIWGWEDICAAMTDKNYSGREEILEMFHEFDPADFTQDDIDGINDFFKDWKVK